MLCELYFSFKIAHTHTPSLGESPAQPFTAIETGSTSLSGFCFLVLEMGAITLTHEVLVPIKSDKARNALGYCAK